MLEQLKKRPLSIGLVAYVGASRREPHFYSFIPGPKTGDFSCPAEARLFQGLKNTTICCGFLIAEAATYGGQFLEFGFVAIFKTKNDTGIDENFSVA